VVQVDESLYTVAQSVYQDGKYFRALYKQNEELIEQAQGQLTGLSLDTPTRRELRRRWPGTVPAKEASISGEERSAAHESMQQFYTTEAGDTLFDISGRKLNQASRYLEIYKMNQLRLDVQTDPYSELPAGISLILPPL
jgi:nucleoid-associated protein YgaU